MEVQIVLISSLILIISVIVLIASKKYKNKEFISFRESLALAELPVITFYQGQTKINLILDTGANKSIINKKCIKNLKYEKTERVACITGISGGIEDNPIINMPFCYKDVEYNDFFQVTDISNTINTIKQTTGVTIHGILGNDFMQKYKYVLDFDKMVAYSKKRFYERNKN